MQTVSQPHQAALTNPSAEATKQSSRSQLATGQLYTGKVLIAREDGIDVLLDDLGVKISDCIWASGIVGAMIGHKTSYMPPADTSVIVMYGKPSFIIGSFSSEFPDATLDSYMTATGGFVRKGMKTFNAKKANTLKNSMPGDLLEGEIDLTNLNATGLRLLTYISQLNAGDRAKVECHLLQDMVRIVSENFKQLSSFGQFEIFNNGRLNMKWDGTSYPHEAWNTVQSRGEKLPVNQTKVTLDSVDKYLSIGRWRMNAYMGFLGDFLNMFISDPVEQIAKIGDAVFQSGKCRIHANGDGALLFQSTSEISFERTCRIPVPVQLKRHEDPTAIAGKEFDELNKEFLKIWDFGGKDAKTIHHAAFQLREYSRWLASYHSLSRFLQMEGDYKVPSEAEVPAPSWHNGEEDRKRANAGGLAYRDVYATIRIMRDGSILNYCSYGHSVLMHKHGVHVSSSKDLTFEAANNIWMVAGQGIYMTARRSIEISAITGGLALKARTWLTGLCEWGSIWLKSDAKDPNKPGYTAETPESDTQDPPPVVLDQAILLDAPQGRVGTFAARQIQLQTQDAPDDTSSRTDMSTGIVLNSKQSNVHVFASKDVNVTSSRGAFIVQAAQEMFVRAKSWISEFTQRLIVFDKTFQFNRNTLQAGNITCDNFKGIQNISGPRRGPMVDPDEGGEGSNPPPLRQHYNHIGEKSKDDKVEYASSDDIKIASEVSLQQTPPKIFPSKNENGPVWDFYSRQAEYARPEVEMFETLSQQQLRQDEPEGYATWNFDNVNKLKTAPKIRTGNKAPFPGAGAMQFQHPKADRLDTPSANSNKKKQTPLKKQKITFRFFKRA